MAKKSLAVILFTLIASSSGSVRGEINSRTTYTLDFTKVREAPWKSTWSDPDQITATPEGLGWGTRTDAGSRDFWLQTEPIGIGLSWRPASITSIKATVDQPGVSGMLYARYSADGKHWTTWQYLQAADPATANGQKETFQATLRVPYREGARYDKLRLDYARREDVAWCSDEEALVKEILQREPSFFERSTPFIGYVQFLYEAQLPGGHRIKGLNLEMSWTLGGKHHAPKEESTWKGRDVAWRFKAP
jgi:hypothetical protein